MRDLFRTTSHWLSDCRGQNVSNSQIRGGHSRMKYIPSLACVLCSAICGVCQGQTVSRVYSFNGSQGGANPLYGMLTQGQNGNLYGTAYDFPGDGAIVKMAIDKGTLTMPVF